MGKSAIVAFTCMIIIISFFWMLTHQSEAGKIQLTNENFDQLNARFSPGGDRIAYSSKEDGGGEFDIWVMNSDGTNHVQLTNEAFPQYVCDWAPDESKISYYSKEDGGNEFDIWTMNPDGTNHLQLTIQNVDQTPSGISPDGSKIIYSSMEDGGGFFDIYTVDILNIRQLTTDDHNQIHPFYNPDGWWIIYSSTEDGGNYYDIWTMNHDGHDKHQLTFEDAHQYSPRYTNDGSRIVYYSKEDGGNNFDIWVMDADGQNHIKVTDQPFDQLMPDFNHNGTKIVYHSDEDQTGFMDIWVFENQYPSVSVNADPVSGRAPLEVSFTGTASDGDGTVVGYQWDFYDGDTSFERNPTHTFTSVGTYWIRLTVTDDFGASTTSDAFRIDVTERKDAELVWSLVRVDSNEGTHFMPTLDIWHERVATYGIAERLLASDRTYFDGEWGKLWEGKHNYIAKATTFIHVKGQFTMSGNLRGDDGHSLYIDGDFVTGVDNTEQPAYSKKLSTGWHKIELLWQEVSGDHGVGLDQLLSDIQYIDDKSIILTTIESDTIAGTAPLTVQFTGSVTDPDGAISTYSWNFSDGSTSNQQNPTHIFTEPGTYLVTFSIVDVDGVNGTDTIEITVTEPVDNPPVATASGDPTSGLAPLTVTFIGTGTDPEGTPVTYLWNFGDGATSTHQNPTHVFDSVGTYTVKLTVSDENGTTSEDSMIITVSAVANNAPRALIIATPSTGTTPLAVSFIGSGTDADGRIISYFWDFGDGTTTDEQNPVHTFSKVGTHSVTLAVTDNGGAIGKKSITIKVTEDDGAEDPIGQPISEENEETGEKEKETEGYGSFLPGVLIVIIVVLLIIIYFMYSWNRMN